MTTPPVMKPSPFGLRPVALLVIEARRHGRPDVAATLVESMHQRVEAVLADADLRKVAEAIAR